MSDDDLIRRFQEQLLGTSKRTYSQGRVGPEDDGDVAMALWIDKEKGRLFLHFGKSVI